MALTCYGITLALAFGGWLGVRGGMARSLVILAVSTCALLMAAIHLGALRRTSESRERSAQARGISKKRARSLA